MVEKIYLDMDGVCCAFRQQCEKYNCIDGNRIDWSVIHSNSPEFWETIEWIPEGKEFYDWLENLCADEDIELYALTAVRHPESRTGRMNWMKKNLNLDRHHLIITNTGAEKAYYAEPSAVLIDDFGKNCDAFANAGGQVVKYVSPTKAKEDIIAMLGKY